MLHATLVKAGESKTLQRQVSGNGWARAQAMRFVAGEELADGLQVVDNLAHSGRSATLDYLGEAVTTLDEAYAARDVYLRALEEIGRKGVDCGVSVKPTQMGLELDEQICEASIAKIAAACDTAGVHLCLDMEDSHVTERTVVLVERLRADGHHDVGCAVQTYLHRTRDDVARLTQAGASLRLCKGAYAEDRRIAYQTRRDVDVNYARCGDYLMREGHYPRLATHDDRLIDYLRHAAVREGRGHGDYEFQMLYGVRETLQTQLIDDGARLRVYVPFGQQWYPYLMRRLAERPANLTFFLRALVGK